MKGQVLSGINNIFTVDVDGKFLQCRIKGKVFKEDKKTYNPITVGDFVLLEADPVSAGIGWIYDREKRKSELLRWNRKRKTPQIIAANVDLVVCVTSVDSPPFRPRFIDRVLVTCEYEGIRPLLLVNKIDLEMTGEIKTRLDNYSSLGYRVILSSARTGAGLEELKEAICGQLTVFCGQSGVGKSSILNTLDPGLKLKVGDVSAKYNRGNHTTCFSTLLNLAQGLRLIDTPGIRELFIYDMDPEQLRFHFPEFPDRARDCSFPACLHIDEPDCAIKAAVASGRIHPDRYESYRRIYTSLVEMKKDLHE